MRLLHQLFSSKSRRSAASQNRLSIDAWPSAIYAIGDVHGCLEQLIALENIILADAGAPAGDKLIVSLGDYVDRGPNSAGVIEHMLRPLRSGFTRVLLAGNHEELMLDAIMGVRDDGWVRFGGIQTMLSYGIDIDLYRASGSRARQKLLAKHVPPEHVAFLEGLAVSLQVEQTVFVHAGIRRNIPIPDQHKNDLFWIRDEFLAAAPTDGLLVVHGHTPASEPEVAAGRIGIDTGAFATGRLSAVRLIPEAAPVFFTTGM